MSYCVTTGMKQTWPWTRRLTWMLWRPTAPQTSLFVGTAGVDSNTNISSPIYCEHRMIFESLHSLVSHKRHYCKLRFTCKCEEEEKTPRELENSVPGVLQCSSCNQDFDDPWDLMEHVQVTKWLYCTDQYCQDQLQIPALTLVGGWLTIKFILFHSPTTHLKFSQLLTSAKFAWRRICFICWSELLIFGCSFIWVCWSKYWSFVQTFYLLICWLSVRLQLSFPTKLAKYNFHWWFCKNMIFLLGSL